MDQRKHEADDAKCKELGWVCVPLVVEAYGDCKTEAAITSGLLPGSVFSGDTASSRVLKN